jgi:hypothetical protein
MRDMAVMTYYRGHFKLKSNKLKVCKIHDSVGKALGTANHTTERSNFVWRGSLCGGAD